MSKQANPTLIGAFVLGALALAVIAVLVLGKGSWFNDRHQQVLYFDGAVQGLQIGAPVVLLGVKVGTVKDIQLGIDRDKHRFLVPVVIQLEPHVVQTRSGPPIDLRDRATMHQLVEQGLRGRLRMQNLLTGQLYVDLDFHPDKPAEFVGLDPDISEIPTIPTAVEELTATLESFDTDKFLADLSAISHSVNKLMSSPATQDLPKRLDSTVRHLDALVARLDAHSGSLLASAQDDLAELHIAVDATRAAMAKVDRAADRVADLAGSDSPVVKAMARASDEMTNAAASLRGLTAQDSPTVQGTNAALKEITRAAEALRRVAELLEQQPDAIYRGKH